MTPGDKSFDYQRLPVGYYDSVVREGSPVRRLWHLSKFENALRCLPSTPGQSLLDVGCFAGTFLSLAPEERFSRQVGVDILADQIAYANEHWARPYREFRTIASLEELKSMNESFDCVTVLEVIEHLQRDEIRILLEGVVSRLNPGGKIVITTPNYASAWPLIERVVNLVSDVSYKEQHITKFTFWNIERELEHIYPRLFKDFSSLDLKRTTHSLAPFLAAFSFDAAHRLSRFTARHRRSFPFGNVILLMLTRASVNTDD